MSVTTHLISVELSDVPISNETSVRKKIIMTIKKIN